MSEKADDGIPEETVRSSENGDETAGAETKQTANETSEGTAQFYCDPCKTENECAEAAGFCEECSEFLCKNCLKVHKRLTITRDHTIKEGSENLENGTRAKEQQKRPTKCPIHTDMELEYFCKNHDELSCLNCISVIHNNCQGVDKVSVIFSHIDFDKKLREIEVEMESLLAEVGTTLYQVKVNLDAVKFTHDETTACIKEARKEADFYFDQLQNIVQDKADVLREENTQIVKTCGKKCKAIEFEVDSVRKRLKSILTQSNQHDKLMALKSAQYVIPSSRNQLTQIRRTNTVNRFYFKPDEELKKLKYYIQTFGDIEQDSSRIKTAKYTKTITLDENPEPTAHITGIEVVDVNQIVTIDNGNKTMTLIDTMENKLLSRIKFETSPWNVARLSDYIFAVTLPDEKRIVKVEKTSKNCLMLLQDQGIKLKRKCSALAANDGKLIVAFCDIQKIVILSENGNLIKTCYPSDEKRLQMSYSSPDIHIAYSPECKCIFVGSFGGHYSHWRTGIFCVENGKITDLTVDGCVSSAVATDRTGMLFYCRSTGIYCYLRGGTHDHSELISLERTRVTSLAYSNKHYILFVAISGGKIAVYYVV